MTISEYLAIAAIVLAIGWCVALFHPLTRGPALGIAKFVGPVFAVVAGALGLAYLTRRKPDDEPEAPRDVLSPREHALDDEDTLAEAQHAADVLAIEVDTDLLSLHRKG